MRGTTAVLMLFGRSRAADSSLNCECKRWNGRPCATGRAVFSLRAAGHRMLTRSTGHAPAGGQDGVHASLLSGLPGCSGVAMRGEVPSHLLEVSPVPKCES